MILDAAHHLDGNLARALADEHGTPLLVVFEEAIERSFRVLEELLPGVTLFYAVKANPDPRILATVARLGGGLDVASPAELAMCEEVGVDARRVLYTQPIKSPGEIALLRERRVEPLVCDNAEEIRKVARHHPGCGVLVRIRVANPFCVVDLGEKFGCEVAQVVPLVELALSSGLRFHGVCFHVGSQSISQSAHVETLKIVKGIADDLALRGVDLEVVDIGGGFPLSYLNPIISIDSFCSPIANTLAHLFGGQTVWAEPGRFIVGDACVLITRVVGKAERDAVTWYYIDDGLYGSLSGKVYDHADYPLRTFREGVPGRCVVAGPTCDSFDIPFRDRSLPELEVGDLVCVESIGAYSVAHATRFNGRPGAARLFITKEGRHELLEPHAC